MFNSSPHKGNCKSQNEKLQNFGVLPEQSPNILAASSKDFGSADLSQSTGENFSNENLNRQSENLEKSPFWSQKRKILVGVVIFVLVSIGLIIFLALELRTEVDKIGKPTQVQLKEGSTMVMAELNLNKKNLFGENSNYKIFATKSISSPTTRLLQEESSIPSNYYWTLNLEKIGVLLTMGSDQSFSMRLDIDALESYLIQSDPNARRLLQEIKQTTTDNQIFTIKNLQQQLSTMISEALQINSPVQLRDTLILNFVLNQETNSFEFQTTNQTKINSRRRLLVRMMLQTKNLEAIKNVVQDSIKPAVYFMQENAELIGQILDGVISGVVGENLGDPAGLLSGIEIESQFGKTASQTLQTFLKVCIPENRYVLQCSLSDPRSVPGLINLPKKTPINNILTSKFMKM